MPEFHTEAPQVTVSEGLAQGPCMTESGKLCYNIIKYTSKYIILLSVMLILNCSLGLDSMPDNKILNDKMVLVSRPFYQGLGLETFLTMVLVSRPGDQGLGLDLNFFRSP